MLRRVRVFLGRRTVAGRSDAAGERVPGTAGENCAAVLPVDAQQPERLPVRGPPGPADRDRVPPHTVHAHVLHHARVPGGRRPAVAQGDRAPDPAPVRRQRDHHRLGTRVRVAVHAGRGQRADGGPNHGPSDKHVTSECRQHNITYTRVDVCI